MKQIDFDHGTVTGNILGAALPMLVAQILSLLYNIVDRIYIARIPSVGTTALGAVGLCFPIIVLITAFSNLFGSGGDVYISVMTIVSSVRQMVETPIYAINEGTSPILSYNYLRIDLYDIDLYSNCVERDYFRTGISDRNFQHRQ